MKTRLHFFVLALTVIALVVISGCVEPTNTETPGHIATNETKEIIFLPYEFLYDAVTGYEYKLSFCEPEPRPGATCGGIEPSTNPIKGSPPYSFSVGYGAGLLPPGMELNLNGVLEGKPNLEGKYTFEICAKDGQGNQACNTYTLRVNDPIYLTTLWTGDGSGSIQPNIGLADPVCEETTGEGNYKCVFPMALKSEVAVTAKANDDSVFNNWDRSCSGTDTCNMYMDVDKTLVADFSLVKKSPVVVINKTTDTGPAVDTVKVTIDTPIGFTCRVDPPSLGSGWSESRYYTVVASGTMSGGKDTASGNFALVETRNDDSTSLGVWKLDCGSWTKTDNDGYTYWYCYKEKDQPETTTWSINEEGGGGNMPKQISVSASVHGRYSEALGRNEYAKDEKVAGTC